jgi:hypothetical protein
VILLLLLLMGLCGCIGLPLYLMIVAEYVLPVACSPACICFTVDSLLRLFSDLRSRSRFHNHPQGSTSQTHHAAPSQPVLSTM